MPRPLDHVLPHGRMDAARSIRRVRKLREPALAPGSGAVPRKLREEIVWQRAVWKASGAAPVDVVKREGDGTSLAVAIGPTLDLKLDVGAIDILNDLGGDKDLKRSIS